jgi:hypothetical protein
LKNSLQASLLTISLTHEKPKRNDKQRNISYKLEFCMSLKEIRIHRRKCISRVVIVALSAQPPGVNKLCVCVTINLEGFRLVAILFVYELQVMY